MATPTIKSTYSLDPLTVRELERLARRFGTSKSEILRRAVKMLALQEAVPGTPQGLQALDELQKLASLSKLRAEEWVDQVRRERAESGRGRPDG